MAVTKQQLQQQVEQLRAECEQLRAENTALRNARSPCGTRKAAMEAARAEAVRTGRTVKVQF